MRRAAVVALQTSALAVGLAAIFGLAGFLVVRFAGWGDAATGLGWGMIVGGGVVGYAAAESGSPSGNRVVRRGSLGGYWSESTPLRQSPLRVVFAASLTFAAGIAVIILSYR